MTEVSMIAVKVRRVTVEVAYVRVLMTQALAEATTPEAVGELLAAGACRVAGQAETLWRREVDPVIEVDPIQTPPPWA